MQREKKPLKIFFTGFIYPIFRTDGDNIKQIIIKVFFLISLITLIVSASYLANYFYRLKSRII